jgi:riboflavin kinase / FMN adenylyltransferase
LHRYHLSSAKYDASAGAVVTLGNFDGVHLGHQQLLNAVKSQAKRLSLPSVVISFQPYPHEFFNGVDNNVRLLRLSEKLQLFAVAGIDFVMCLRFDEQLANTSPLEFVQTYLIQRWQVKHLVIGDDFRFGANRAGDVHLLRQIGEREGFTVDQLPTYELYQDRVSSSRIRDLLKQGDLVMAEALLGRPYCVSSRVTRGDQRGREWGFPTANLPLFRSKPPLQGIFAVRVTGEDFRANGVASIGFRPVFELKQPLLEVFLLDFERDIYGQRLQVEFLYKIRDEENFSSVDALKQRIQVDVDMAREYFAQL